MAFRVVTRQASAGDLSGTVYELHGDNCFAEVWPFAGFNCLKWQIDGRDLIFSMPDFAANPVPTRSGNPILFPFPNRLAFGQLHHLGKTYQLPLTEATKTHSIHGFTPRSPWRVLGSGVTDSSAFVTARFRMSERFENWQSLWPGDLSITLTYTLTKSSLQVDAEIENFGDLASAYGLGYHGYFRPLNAKPDETLEKWLFQSRTDQIWDCVANMPAGSRSPTPADLNFTAERPLGAVQFDTLLTGLEPGQGMRTVATLRHPDHPGRLEIRADETYPHLVLFTPAHRKAIAIEPYTCATNASNLPPETPHGWRQLAAGAKNQHRVEYRWNGSGS